MLIKLKNSLLMLKDLIHPFPNRIGDSTIGYENLGLYHNSIELFNSLNKDIKEKIIFLPKQEYTLGQAFHLKKYLSSHQIKKSNMFNFYNGKSKLNILTYPETAFCKLTFPHLPFCYMKKRSGNLKTI